MTAYAGQVPEIRRCTPHWLTFAACRAEGVHPDEMFPDSNAVLIEHAKSICRACPVQLTCLDDALRTGDDQHGIRGGLKPEERRTVRSRRVARHTRRTSRTHRVAGTRRGPATPDAFRP